MHQRTQQLMTSEGLRGCLSPTTGHSCDHPLHNGLCNQLLWDYNPTNNVMGWVDFAGYVTCCLSELSGFPYPVFPAKKDDIAPTVRLQLPTCFATPKYAGRLFWISSIYLIRAFVWGKKFHPTIWDWSGFRLLFGLACGKFQEMIPHLTCRTFWAKRKTSTN